MSEFPKVIVGEPGDTVVLAEKREDVITETFPAWEGIEEASAFHSEYEIARRIAAALNATRDIPLETLEEYVVMTSDPDCYAKGGTIFCGGLHVMAVAAEERNKIASRIAAADRFCRAQGIDPSAADPLKAYRERVCQEQREVCAEVVFSNSVGRSAQAISKAVKTMPSPPDSAADRDAEIDTNLHHIGLDMTEWYQVWGLGERDITVPRDGKTARLIRETKELMRLDNEQRRVNRRQEKESENH